jgi:hypothetical protein
MIHRSVPMVAMTTSDDREDIMRGVVVVNGPHGVRSRR